MSNLGLSTPAKCLLFGEYTILQGGNAVAIPLPMFKGSLELHQPFSQSHKSIQSFYNYLLERKNDLPEANYDLLTKDIEQGLSFQSNIPIGYGLGSSGALVAALFKRYFYSQDNLSLVELKKFLSIMEQFFHGKSSGFDPLISYKQESLFYNLEKVSSIEIFWPKGIDILLVNSRVSRKTDDLVKAFEKKTEDKAFLSLLKDKLIPLNNNLIESLLNESEDEDFFRNLQLLSRYQLEAFSSMIPQKIQRLMQNMLTASHSAIKLCGAGGGGFFLCFSRDIELTKNVLNEFDGIDYQKLLK